MEAWGRKKKYLNASLINIGPCPREQHWASRGCWEHSRKSQLARRCSAHLWASLSFPPMLALPFMPVFGPHDGSCREAPFPLSLTMLQYCLCSSSSDSNAIPSLVHNKLKTEINSGLTRCINAWKIVWLYWHWEWTPKYARTQAKMPAAPNRKD